MQWMKNFMAVTQTLTFICHRLSVSSITGLSLSHDSSLSLSLSLSPFSSSDAVLQLRFMRVPPEPKLLQPPPAAHWPRLREIHQERNHILLYDRREPILSARRTQIQTLFHLQALLGFVQEKNKASLPEMRGPRRKLEGAPISFVERNVGEPNVQHQVTRPAAFVDGGLDCHRLIENSIAVFLM